MTEIISAHIYDFPKYYDLVYGSDWRAEFEFLKACFRRHAGRDVRRLFEPACGTGRLLYRFARGGFEVAGIDLNPQAVEFCNRRLVRHGFPASVSVGDMSRFSLLRKVDAAFNMINSFRHLMTEEEALGHLECVAEALATGGLYVLGLHLTPTQGERTDQESWSARRGNLAVISTLWSESLDLESRIERIGMCYDVYTPTAHRRIVDEVPHRTYTAQQMAQLLSQVPSLEVVETCDFAYEIDEPVVIEPHTEDVVFVLRKK